MTELLVGTDTGLYVLDEDGGAWNVAARFLEGTEINHVVREASGTVLASSREGGLVRIDVGAGTVTPLGAGTLPTAVRAVAVAPSDPAVIYVGTEPAAIFCSRDGGATWREDPVVAELRAARNWQYPGTMESHIRDITIDRENPECVWAAVQIGGVLRTEDGGAHWEDVTVDVDPDVHKIVQHPDDAGVLYAVTGGGGEYPHPTPEHRIKPPYPHGRPVYKSTDRGRTWTSISDDVPQSYRDPDRGTRRQPTGVAGRRRVRRAAALGRATGQSRRGADRQRGRRRDVDRGLRRFAATVVGDVRCDRGRRTPPPFLCRNERSALRFK